MTKVSGQARCGVLAYTRNDFEHDVQVASLWRFTNFNIYSTKYSTRHDTNTKEGYQIRGGAIKEGQTGIDAGHECMNYQSSVVRFQEETATG